MDQASERAVPGWFWAVAGLALLWEAFGCYAYLSVVTLAPDARPPAYAVMAEWQYGAFAVAVWSGLLGAIGLVLRRSWAIWGFAVSLVAAVAQYGSLLSAGAVPASDRPMAIVIIVAGIALAAFARAASQRGWLR